MKKKHVVQRPAISAEMAERLGISMQAAERLAIGAVTPEEPAMSAVAAEGSAISAETTERLGLSVPAAERLAAGARKTEKPRSGKGGTGAMKGEVQITPGWPTAATSSMQDGVPMPPTSWLERDRNHEKSHQHHGEGHRSREHRRTPRGRHQGDGGSRWKWRPTAGLRSSGR